LLIDDHSLDFHTGHKPDESADFHACTSEVMGGCNKLHEWNRIKYPNSSNVAVCHGSVQQHAHLDEQSSNSISQSIIISTPSGSTPTSFQLNNNSNLKRKRGNCRPIENEADSTRPKVLKDEHGERIGKGEDVVCDASKSEGELRELDDEELNRIFDDCAGSSV